MIIISQVAGKDGDLLETIIGCEDEDDEQAFLPAVCV